MPRRTRPAEAQRSEHWLRVMVNERADELDQAIGKAFGWKSEGIEWLSPRADDQFAEYFDDAFLERLGVKDLKMPLSDFWPASGPRWDGLGKTKSGKVILVEAKAHIDECVDFRCRASSSSLARIHARLDEAKKAFGAAEDANWHSPFYQKANRLAHLDFLARRNLRDAYLVFVYFANAPDVPRPVSAEKWSGAIELSHKCLGLGESPLARRVAEVVIDVKASRGDGGSASTEEARRAFGRKFAQLPEASKRALYRAFRKRYG